MSQLVTHVFDQVSAHHFSFPTLHTTLVPTFETGSEQFLQGKCTKVSIPIIGTTDDALAVEANAANQLLVPFQHSQARPTLNVPQPAMQSDEM